MAKYVFIYHGGAMAETEEEQAAVMAAWQTWMGGLGDALADGGNAFAQAKTITADGSISEGGGSNPATGYSLVTANSLDEAVLLAKGCPIFDNGGSVEVAATIEM